MGVWQWLAAVARRGATRAKALPRLVAEDETASNTSMPGPGDFPTFLSEFGGGDCRWDFNDLGFPRESSSR